MKRATEIKSHKVCGCIVLLIVMAVLIAIFTNRTNAQGMAPTARTPGAPAGSYKLGGFDNVNLFSGNLNFNLSLLNIDGRGELSQDLSLTLDTQWNVQGSFDGVGNSIYEFNPVVQQPLSFVGSVITSSELPVTLFEEETCVNNLEVYWIQHQFNFKYVEPNGTEHMLVDPLYHGKPHRECNTVSVNYGRVFESTSGEFMTFIADADVLTTMNAPSGYLYFRNGSKSRVEVEKFFGHKTVMAINLSIHIIRITIFLIIFQASRK